MDAVHSNAAAHFAPANDHDPFNLARHVISPKGASLICALEPNDAVLPPDAPSRTICRLEDGRIILAEVRNCTAFQIGQPVDMGEAGQIALSILIGSQRALTAPGNMQALALAYLAALAIQEPLAAPGAGAPGAAQ